VVPSFSFLQEHCTHFLRVPLLSHPHYMPADFILHDLIVLIGEPVTELLIAEFYPASSYFLSRGSTEGVATGHGLVDRGVGVQVPGGTRFFSPPHRSDRFWGPPSLLPSGYRGTLLWGKSDRGVKLITHLQPVPRTRIRGSIHLLPHASSWRSA
jgi:hypothetical protein